MVARPQRAALVDAALERPGADQVGRGSVQAAVRFGVSRCRAAYGQLAADEPAAALRPSTGGVLRAEVISPLAADARGNLRGTDHRPAAATAAALRAKLRFVRISRTPQLMS